MPSSQRVLRPGDTEPVINLLRVLIELCLGPRLRLPQLNLGLYGFYRLENWHIRYFEHVQQEKGEAESQHQNRMTTVLVPIFKSINRCISPDSLYLHCYKVHWEELSKVLAEAFPQVDQLREFLTEDIPNDNMCTFVDDRNDNNVSLGAAAGKEDVMLRLEALRLRLMPFLQSTQRQSERNRVWIGFAE